MDMHVSNRVARHAYDACPLCAAPDIRELRQADCAGHALYTPAIPSTMTWMQCGTCDHQFTEGYWTDEMRGEIFAKTHPNQKPGADMERNRGIAARIVDKVAARFIGVPTALDEWLDVGFGNAALLFTAAEYGFHPVGLDLREDSVAALERIGIEAHCCDLTDFTSEPKFAVISMADVLEHMPYPKKGLAVARKLIRDDGLLFISCPNAESPLWALWEAQGVNPYWQEIEHYHNFTRTRLYALLRETGFTPVAYSASERYRCGMEVMARAT
jgi:SAM-dependent methyltransferase